MSNTIIDIARMAGVSTATVSRVLNDYPFIKEKTRNKVLVAIQELNYYPDMIARSMVKGKTDSIGLIIGTLGNPFFAETAEVIIKTAEKYNCHVTLCVTEEKSWKLSKYVDLLLTKRVDGVIIGSAFKGEPIPRLAKAKIPYVLYNRTDGEESTDFIVQDNFNGAYDAVNHLIRLGHTKIGVLHGPLMFDTVAERLQGYMKALQDYKLKTYPHFMHQVNFEEAQPDIMKAMSEMFKNHPLPTAIFTTADFLALGAIEYLIKEGYRVPEDVSLVGFDNTRISGHSLISLTTVGQQAEEMAKLAVERLMQKIEQKQNGESSDNPWKIKLKPQLIVRRTCGNHLRGG